MSKLKKIITGGFEAVKDSAKQIVDTVSPGAIVEQALGHQGGKKDELSDYLQNLSSVSSEELEKKKKELTEEDQKKLEETRKKLLTTMPSHMRPQQKPPGLRPYETTIQEEEKKKAQAVEAQKKQSQSVPAPAGKQPRGMLFGKRKTGGKGFEGLVKDTKVG